MTFTKDTLIGGIICRELKQDYINTYCDPGVGCGNSSNKEYFFQRNDSLFQLVPTATPTINFVFNYRCRIGDSILLPLNPSRPTQYVAKIRRIGDTALNGKRLKFWELQESCNRSSGVFYSSTHYEYLLTTKLGGYSAAINSFCVHNNHFAQTLCSFEGGNWRYFTQNCRNSTQEIAFGLYLFPNPTVESLSLTSPQYFEADYDIYDLSGRVVQKGNCTEGSKLDVSRLSQGLYFLALHNADGQSIRKFIKH
jgi:hypothetical protein